MKIRNIINSTIALFMVLTFASCDALDLKPISFITNESFWQTEDDVKGALNGIYVQLRGAAEHDLYILGEARSEILTVGIGGYGGYDIYYYNTLTQANMPISWIRYYQIVNSCNLLLKYAPNVTFNNETSRNKMLAQAYTMRAFMYFVMTRTWGDLIIHTDPIENTNSEVLYKERRPQTEVFQLIKDDLEKALSLYPDDNFGDQRAMWSKPATLALKAEVYLWSGKKMNGGSSDIETALNALNSIKTDKLRLQPDFADVFAYDIKKLTHTSISFRVKTAKFDEEILLTMPGLFNVENALAAIATAMVLDIPFKNIYNGLKVARASGRMEAHVSKDGNIIVIVDYAHNKLSFQKLYESTKQEYPDKNIITVFGCPGGKAQLRRRDLGTLSGIHSKISYLTAEDPGPEETVDICKEIAEYVAKEHGNYKIIEDRGEAIKEAILDNPNSVVLIITFEKAIV